jgi:hypothetical protein
MTPRRFTDEQKDILLKNPNTAYVSNSVIKFTQEFKVKLVESVEQGVPVRRFIQEAGYDYEMLGDDRIKTFVSRWRKEARIGNIHDGYKERKRHPDLADYKDMEPEEAMQHMQNEILYLHQELDFIKKM